MTPGASDSKEFTVGVDESSPWAQVEEYESRQLVKQLAVAGRSELYAGIAQGADQFTSIAFTEKYQLVESQIGHLFSANLSCDPTEIVLVQGTSGTSGKILRLPFTRNDIASYARRRRIRRGAPHLPRSLAGSIPRWWSWAPSSSALRPITPPRRRRSQSLW